jgi:transcriptional regulator with XRE-family HTH domain
MAKRSPDPVDKYVGARIRMRRIMLSFSQTQLAAALGVTFQQVQHYERGSSRVGASTLQGIADTLQVPVSFFFEGAPLNQTEPDQVAAAPFPQFVAAFISTRDGLDLMRAFTSIKNTAIRRRIVRLVEQIVNSKN